MVVLSKSERRIYCIMFAKHVPKIRELLHLTQLQFGAMCGISADRLSRIENEHTIMTWSQLTSILFVCAANLCTKEYLYANKVFDMRFLQYFQQKDENIPPSVNICVREELVNSYIDKKERN